MQKEKISTSLNVSTYNWPAALELCLLSIKALKVLPDEVIITDDGSTDSTRQLIHDIRKDFPVPIKHVWQPDEGFQLAKIRNKGIAASSYEYIIQIDGDLILHPMFIADHIAIAKKGHFVSGSRVILGSQYSESLLKAKEIDVSVFHTDVKNRPNGYRIGLLSNYLAGRYKKNNLFYMRGCNMAFWRDTLVKVNGYNEEFTGWGREDNEIAVRMINNGIKKRFVKFGAIVYHLFHPEAQRAGFNINEELLAEAIATKSTICKKGLDQYL